MRKKPKCIIITGQPGSGKTTLAKKLGERLWLPVISRDEIKEGYVNTYGVKHDQLPPDTNGLVSENPSREFYHGDKRVALYRKTGEISPPNSYAEPKFDIPTIQVSTDGEYIPCIDEIVKQIQ